MTLGRRLTAMRAVVTVFACLIGLGLQAPAAQADVLKVGDRLVELDVATDGNGRAVKLKSYKNRWLFVTVGAGWCVPCKKELPAWDKVAADLKTKLTFVALTLDDDIADGKRFHKKLGLKNMVVVYLPQDKSAVAARYGAQTMPTTFVIDPQGVVRMVHAGFKERDPNGEYRKMKSALEKLVK